MDILLHKLWHIKTFMLYLCYRFAMFNFILQPIQSLLNEIAYRPSKETVQVLKQELLKDWSNHWPGNLRHVFSNFVILHLSKVRNDKDYSCLTSAYFKVLFKCCNFQKTTSFKWYSPPMHIQRDLRFQPVAWCFHFVPIPCLQFSAFSNLIFFLPFPLP